MRIIWDFEPWSILRFSGYGNAAGLLYQNGFLTKGFTPDDGDDYSDDDDDQQREKLVSYQMNKKKNEKFVKTKIIIKYFSTYVLFQKENSRTR